MIQINNLDEMVEEYVRALIQSSYSNTDTSDNSPVIDLIAKPMETIVKRVIDMGTDIENRSNLDNADEMSEDDMDEIGNGNYMSERNAGDKATGTATLKFKSISDTQNTVIPSGIELSTKTGLSYLTTVGKTLSPSEMYQEWNDIDLTYDVDISVEASETGSDYNIEPGQLTVIVNGFTSYEVSVTNNAAFSNGSDKETNSEYAERVLKYLSSRTLETSPGYEQDIKENFPVVEDIHVAGYEDPLMERDLAESITVNGVTYTNRHIGGKTDIYIRGHEATSKALSVTAKHTTLFPLSVPSDQVDASSLVVLNTSDGNAVLSKTGSTDEAGRYIVDVTGATLSDGDVLTFSYDADLDDDDVYEAATVDTFTYETSSHLLLSPFIGVTSLYNSSTASGVDTYYDSTLQGGDYDITYEDDDYIGTSREVAYLELLIDGSDGVVHGDTIEISYTYNSTVKDIATHYDTVGNRVVTRDLLIRSSSPIYVQVGLSVKLLDGVSQTSAVESAISNVLNTVFADTAMGSKIDESDLISYIYEDETTGALVDYISLPLSTFHFTGDVDEDFQTGTHDADPVQLGDVEYPILQELKLTYL